MARISLNKFLDDVVAANDTVTWTTAVIPNGEEWVIRTFGGAALEKAIILLQLRTATGPDVWTTVRAVMGPGQFEYAFKQTMTGDGIKQFRIRRLEKSGSSQVIAAWFHGYKRT